MTQTSERPLIPYTCQAPDCGKTFWVSQGSRRQYCGECGKRRSSESWKNREKYKGQDRLLLLSRAERRADDAY